MHDMSAMLHQTMAGSLGDTRFEYARLSGLSHEERDQVVAEAHAALAETNDAIARPDTQRAKAVLLLYQYATRFTYDVEASSKRHFLEAMRCLWRGDDEDALSWQWNPPSKDAFISGVKEHLPLVDFYSQVNLLCNELFGIPFPTMSDTSLNAWAERAGLSEDRWSARYESRIEEERSRWFVSKKRLDAIEADRTEHRKKAALCIEEVAPVFHEVAPASARLQDLKRRELGLSVYCHTLDRVSAALNKGVQLNHLLLEEAHGMGSIFRAAARGL